MSSLIFSVCNDITNSLIALSKFCWENIITM